jgi:hypothetical protein
MATIMLTHSWLKYINIELLTMWVVIETYWSKTSMLTTCILVTAHILNNDVSIKCTQENFSIIPVVISMLLYLRAALYTFNHVHVQLLY